MTHRQFQELIASKPYNDAKQLVEERTHETPFLATIYHVYLNLMIGTVKGVRDQLNTLVGSKTSDPLERNILNTLWAYYYFRVGNLQLSKDHLADTQQFFESLEDENDELGFWIYLCLNTRGCVTARDGHYEDSLDNFYKSLEWAQKINSNNLIIQALNNYGYSNLLLMRLDEAKKNLELSLQELQKSGFQEFLYYPISNLGIYYFLQGDLKSSEKYHLEALKLASTNENEFQIASQYRDLGLLYKKKADYESALEYLQKALQLHVQIANNIWTANTLVYLIELSLVLGHQTLADAYYAHLTSLGLDTTNEMVIGLREFGKALVHKDQPKIKSKVVAENLFKDLSSNKSLDRETRIRAMLYYSELLLTEFQMIGSPEILVEINQIIHELMLFSQNSHSKSMQAEALCIQAQISLLTNEFEQGITHFMEAREIAVKNELKYLQSQIEERLDKFQEHIHKFQDQLNSDDVRKEFIQDYLTTYLLEVLQIRKEFKE